MCAAYELQPAELRQTFGLCLQARTWVDLSQGIVAVFTFQSNISFSKPKRSFRHEES